MLELKQNEGMWLISEAGKSVAEIHLDYSEQVEEVVLYADSSAETQLSVLRLAASHTQQFMFDRRLPTMGGILTAVYKDKSLVRADSPRLMRFDLIPEEITKLDHETLVKELRPFGINVTVAVHATLEEAMDAAFFQVGLEDLTYRVIKKYLTLRKEADLRFRVSAPYHFTIWKSTDLPSGDMHFDIVPPYHPIVNGYKEVGMINGDSDAYIGGKSVRHIYAPKAVRADRNGRFSMGGSWTHMKHPYCAHGRTLDLCVVTTKLRSTKGVEELVVLLRSVLNLDKTYISVAGGFRPPIKLAADRERDYPWPPRQGRPARGTAHSCAWEYHVLLQEGKLEKARVPAWFVNEGYLDLFKNAEIGPSTFN